MRLASAPVTWGVWERTIDRDDLIPARDLLRTVVELGYTGIELGPPGYLSPDLLAEFGLELVGGFAPLRFADADGFAADVPLWLDPVIDALLATGAKGPVVLADAERTSFDDAAFGRVQEAVDRCRARGVPVVFHHHAATSIETPEELAALLGRTDVGICFDTGHALVGGGDPVEVARLCRGRIEHLHLKDVDTSKLGLPLDQAWEEGIFCPFGEGAVDFAAVLAEVDGFDGWTVLEQDRVAVRVDDLPAVRTTEAANLELVRSRDGHSH